MPADRHEPRPPRAATWACIVLLGLLGFQWIGNNVQTALIQLGERMWPGYGSELRREPAPPEPPEAEPPPPAEESAEAKAAREREEIDGAAANELLALEQAAEGETGPPPRSAAEEQRERHAERMLRHAEAQARHEGVVARRSGAVRLYSAVERGLADACAWIADHLRHLFVALVALCGAVATWSRKHVALAEIRGARADRTAQGVALAANLVLLASVVAQWQLRRSAGTGSQDDLLAGLWMLTFAGMAGVNLHHLARPRRGAAQTRLQALQCVPLYAMMAVLAGAYFLAVERYPAGLAVYLEKLLQSAQLYLQVGLYVWAGMLLKRSQLATRGFDVLRPWNLRPELLAAIVVALSALPTAYSGASGIFVLAAGGLIYGELRDAGARQPLALAATAMSGSLGVVLSPCLLVMIIAYLDNAVASEELFGWGRWVFLLTAGLFTTVALATQRRRPPARRGPDAGRASLRALAGLWRYAVVFAGLLLACHFAFGVSLDPQSAPVLLPLALVLILAFERRDDPERAPGLIVAATGEATLHIGALLLLMALSACLGGAIERSELVSAVPAFDSPWPAMGVLVVVLVLIGMVMDPYGAAILVYAALTKVAYASGISPVHFWMVVLVAFELGYLTPPVALNHLLTRQVVHDEIVAPTGDFWARHERYLLPISVMAIALLAVAFGPLLWAGPW